MATLDPYVTALAEFVSIKLKSSNELINSIKATRFEKVVRFRNPSMASVKPELKVELSRCRWLTDDVLMEQDLLMVLQRAFGDCGKDGDMLYESVDNRLGACQVKEQWFGGVI